MTQFEYNGYGIDMASAIIGIMKKESVERPFFVAGKASRFLNIEADIKTEYPHSIFFGDFLPNPDYKSVIKGRSIFIENKCDFIAAIGGGSAIDVAKCIKAYDFMNEADFCINKEIAASSIKILAVPTTAGTGSEATHFAVIYYDGEKKSVAHECLLPDYVILCERALENLPLYQRKATMLDALCHGIESLWSVNSTETSRKYASDAIGMFKDFYKPYLNNEPEGNQKMLCAANSAGKAINITKTTAAHAMSYKMTSMYGISHGHSVALCLPRVWEYMINNMDKCIDARGEKFLSLRFQHISHLLGCSSAKDAIGWMDELIFKELSLEQPIASSAEDAAILAGAVNSERLANNPVLLEDSALAEIYEGILRG